MTLEEAIIHAEEIAKKNEEQYKDCPMWLDGEYVGVKTAEECASEHRQLAEWLKELKRYKECELKCKSCPFFMEIGDVCGECANYWRGEQDE